MTVRSGSAKSDHQVLTFVFNFYISPVWPHTYASPSAFSERVVVSYWRKYVHEVLVNRLGGLSLSRKSVIRFTDRPNITLDVYHGRKATIQQFNEYKQNSTNHLRKSAL